VPAREVFVIPMTERNFSNPAVLHWVVELPGENEGRKTIMSFCKGWMEVCKHSPQPRLV